MDNFSIEIDADGVAHITFDVPGRSMNTISKSVQRDLGALAERLSGDIEIRGAILRSGKASGFCAGADLKEMVGDIEGWRAAATQDELRAGVDDASGFSSRIRALETCGKPIVAIVEGLALGGGLELVLGCHYRLVVEGADIRLSFPEVGIGLLPGAGGTQRVSRIIGIAAAVPLLVDGAQISVETALATGLFHAALPANQIVEEARRWILEGGSSIAPWDEKGFALPGGSVHSAMGQTQFGPAMAARLAGGQNLAVSNVFKCIYEGSQVPIDAGLRIESRYFFVTARSEEARERVAEFLERKPSPRPARSCASGQVNS